MINVEKEKWQAMGELWVKSTQGLSKLPSLSVPKPKYANSCLTSSSLGRMWQLLTEFIQAKVTGIRTHPAAREL